MGKPHYILLLLIVITIALLSSWLLRSVGQTTLTQTPQTKQSRDYYLVNFTTTIMDEKGIPFYKLSSPYLEHFPISQIMELEKPELFIYSIPQYPWKLNAKQSIVTDHGNQINLSGNVKIQRDLQQQDQKIVITTQKLSVLIDKQTATTQHKINMSHGKSNFHATGMRINLTNNTLELLSDVQGMYEIQPR